MGNRQLHPRHAQKKDRVYQRDDGALAIGNDVALAEHLAVIQVTPRLFFADAGGSCPQEPNLSAARAFALAASSSRLFAGALVSRERRRRVETWAISSIALRNADSFAFDGLLNPLIFNLFVSDRRIEVEKSFDISAHKL
jgi:hypothetical protein